MRQLPDEELPEYKTKTGRAKKRKSLVGVIHGAKDTSTGIVDIAMAGSLFKKGEPHRRLKSYGMVLVDECHHSASETVSRVLREVSSKYVYGVTATPFRGDGLEKINEMLLGPVRFRYTAKEKADEHRIELMEELRHAGVNIELVKDHCEHYAVIDNEIVWYGSMNLLSKDDIEDNIMRVVSKQIAAELLEMTFKKGSAIQQLVLPLP